MILSIGFVQIMSPYQIYLPYSVGLLQAFTQAHAREPSRYSFLLPIYSEKEPLEKSVAKLQSADIVGFSTYIWNMNRSLAIAQALKQQNPNVLIVFGGPQVPNQAETFLRKHPFIDVCCHGEGEQVFLHLLEAYPELKQPYPGVSFIDSKGKFCTSPKAPRLKEIDQIPSPYLSGVFDELIATSSQEQWWVTWETNRGCPFSCTFCDWGSAINSKVFAFDINRLYQEIDWFSRHKIEFIFCCDANVGILKRDLDWAEYMVKVKQETNFPAQIGTQTTKNLTERAYTLQKALYHSNLNREIALSLQSLSPQTLTYIKRDNISSETYQELQRRFTRDGVRTYTDMILALPGETYDSYAQSISDVIANGQHRSIKFYNLALLPNAEISSLESRQTHGLETIWIKIVNVRDPVEPDPGEVDEFQEVVISTKTMPRDDWVRAKVFGLMTSFLYFNVRLLQIPLIFLQQLHGIVPRQLIEWFTTSSLEGMPVTQEVLTLFQTKAQAIQQGDFEYYRGEPWAPIWWFIDEFIIARMFVELKIGDFLEEAKQQLTHFIELHALDFDPDLLEDAIQLSQMMFDLTYKKQRALELNYNSWDYYLSILKGQPIQLIKQRHHQTISNQDLPA